MKNLIEATRKENNVSQESLANAIGVSRQTIVSIEQEKCTPSVAIALKMARFFDMTVEELFLFEDNPSWKKDPSNNQNYQDNATIDRQGFVFGQGGCTDYRYGRFPLSFNGGEIIAVYNALLLLGKQMLLHEIIMEFEENHLPVLGGLAGTDPQKIGMYFLAHQIPYKSINSDRTFGQELVKKDRQVFILAYYDIMGPLELKGLHTVAGYSENGTIHILNLKKGDTDIRTFSSYNALKKGKKFIIGYLLDNAESLEA